MSEDRNNVKNRLKLLNIAQKLGSVTEACRIMGYSRDSFYRFKKLFENSGEAALQKISGQKPNLKNRLGEKIEKTVLAFAQKKPDYGQQRVSDELKKRDIFVSPATVRNIWLRHSLETFTKRLERKTQHKEYFRSQY